ncbi:MAG: beta-1,6-N-acetylglucosaminyltransferase [Nodosilinea sp.]
MRISYIISAYKYPEQLVRLVRCLNEVDANFLIHIDKKSNNKVFSIAQKELSDLKNVTFLERHSCYWGDFGHVQSTIKGIQAICDQQIDFDYLFLLTGQCYPIKPKQEIKHFLKNHHDYSFMDYKIIDSYRNKKRVERWNIRLFSRFYVSFPNRYIPIPVKRSYPESVEFFFKGSSYWCLSREAVAYLQNFLSADSPRNKQLINFFRGVYIPDEIFFQTILINSPLKDKIINENLWYIDWPSGSYVPSPRVLDESYYYELVSSPKLFARKFDMERSPKILDLLDSLNTKQMNCDAP